MDSLKPQTRDIGFPVRRLLPAAGRRRVGPFIFFDHMGPHVFPADSREGDVLPHPHVGLATVTYLFSGSMMHHDSLGTGQRIEPGAINLMTAGRGITHSERIPEDIRAAGTAVEGIQIWLALPLSQEEGDPDFSHHPAEALPVHHEQGVTARVLLGAAFGLESPVPVASPTLCVDIQLEQGASLPLPTSDEERALYVAGGTPRVGDLPLPTHQVTTLGSDRSWLVETFDGPARLILFGGEPLTHECYLEWNFASSRAEHLKQAKEDWRERRFDDIPGETEWIPLPGE